MKRLRLYVRFYRYYALVSIGLTLACGWFVFLYGARPLNLLVWFKAITLGLTVYFLNEYKRADFYYFKNLGISKRRLWGVTLSWDAALFLLVVSVALIAH